MIFSSCGLPPRPLSGMPTTRSCVKCCQRHSPKRHNLGGYGHRSAASGMSVSSETFCCLAKADKGSQISGDQLEVT